MMRMAPVLLALAFASGLGGCNPAAPVDAPKLDVTVGVQAAVDDQAAYRGAAVAGQVCARCHDIGIGTPPAVDIGAPRFRDIAGRPEATASNLAAKMRDLHPAMPEYIFNDPEISDLAAYLLSLAGDPG